MSRSILVAFLFAALALTVPATAAGATPTCNGKKATYVLQPGGGSYAGTSGNDVIVGTSGPDTIGGGGGNDAICGLGGDDIISGGNDDDVLFGGDGDDTIDKTDNTGNDVIKGGNGNDKLGDFITAPPGDDVYDGEAGNEEIDDISGKNVAHGGPGSDNVVVTGHAYGDAGDDPNVLAFETSEGAGDAYASGGSGSDGDGECTAGAVVVWGGTADGGSGNDLVCVVLAGDTALGGSGSDFVGGAVLDPVSQVLDCGSGFDTYVAAGGDTVRRCEQVGGN